MNTEGSYLQGATDALSLLISGEGTVEVENGTLTVKLNEEYFQAAIDRNIWEYDYGLPIVKEEKDWKTKLREKWGRVEPTPEPLDNRAERYCADHQWVREKKGLTVQKAVRFILCTFSVGKIPILAFA
jgi:hypothetical protein